MWTCESLIRREGSKFVESTWRGIELFPSSFRDFEGLEQGILEDGREESILDGWDVGLKEYPWLVGRIAEKSDGSSLLIGGWLSSREKERDWRWSRIFCSIPNVCEDSKDSKKEEQLVENWKVFESN